MLQSVVFNDVEEPGNLHSWQEWKLQHLLPALSLTFVPRLLLFIVFISHFPFYFSVLTTLYLRQSQYLLIEFVCVLPCMDFLVSGKDFVNGAYRFAAVCVQGDVVLTFVSLIFGYMQSFFYTLFNHCITYFHFGCLLCWLCPLTPSFCSSQACVRVLQPWPASQLHRGREHAHKYERGHAHHGLAAQWRRPPGSGEAGPLTKAPQLHEQNPPAHTSGLAWGIWLVGRRHQRVWCRSLCSQENVSSGLGLTNCPAFVQFMYCNVPQCIWPRVRRS